MRGEERRGKERSEERSEGKYGEREESALASSDE